MDFCHNGNDIIRSGRVDNKEIERYLGPYGENVKNDNGNRLMDDYVITNLNTGSNLLEKFLQE